MTSNRKLILYNDDAYEIIKQFEKNNIKVDHIITDPPYNISQKNGFATMSSANRTGLDFGEWDKNFDSYSWISQYGKLVRKGGSMIIFTSYRYVSYIADYLEKSEFIVKDLIRWIKKNPMPRNVNRRYVQDAEFALWAVKTGAKWVFNKPDDVPYLRSEFHTSVVSGNERLKHPTQKSLKLMNDIIKIHTNKRELIMDPFMGTGTTGIAANRLGRNFIGVELNKDYFNIAKERFKNEEYNLFE